MPLKQFLHEEAAADKIEEELGKREKPEEKVEEGKKTDEKPQVNSEPATWAGVKDTDLFVCRGRKRFRCSKKLGATISLKMLRPTANGKVHLAIR